jgi:uncharacterized protein YkwD
MRRALFLVAVVVLASPAAAAAQCEPVTMGGSIHADYGKRVVELVNAHRASLSPPAPPVEISRTLMRSAIWKAQHMFKYVYFGPNDPAPPVDRTPDQRAQACGYPTGVGESIAQTFSTPESVMAGWLNSPDDRARIENPDWRAIGVGETGEYWAADFGTAEDAPNAPPHAVDDEATMPETHRVKVINLRDNDFDEDLAWAYAVTDGPRHGAVVDTNYGRSAIYQPASGFIGTDRFRYTLVDLAGEQSTATVTVHVKLVDHPPHARDDVVRLRRHTRRAVIDPTRNDRDADGDRLRVTRVESWEGRGVATVKHGRIVYRPPSGRVRRDLLHYLVYDGRKADEAFVRIRPKRKRR